MTLLGNGMKPKFIQRSLKEKFVSQVQTYKETALLEYTIDVKGS